MSLSETAFFLTVSTMLAVQLHTFTCVHFYSRPPATTRTVVLQPAQDSGDRGRAGNGLAVPKTWPPLADLATRTRRT